MKRFKTWLAFLCRYTFRKKLFWILLLAMLILSAASRITNNRRQVIRVGLYCESADSLTQAAIQELLTGDDGLYCFYLSPSFQMLQEDVGARKAECAYVFPSGLEESMRQGREGAVTVYTSSSTVLTSIVNEAVYNALFHEYAKTMLTDYAKEHDIVSLGHEELAAEVSRLYSLQEENTATFHVVYEDVPESFYDDQAAFRIPLRGLIALLVFLASLAGASQYRHDKQRGYFLLRFPKEAQYVPMLYSLLPGLFLSIAGFLCLLLSETVRLSGGAGAVLTELILLPGFALLTALAAFLLSALIRSSLLFDALIPLLMIFCLLYSPVLAELSGYLPAGNILEWLAPTTWYLRLAALRVS